MKERLQTVLCLAVSLILFTACNKEDTPYDRYLAALEQLFTTDSVTIQWTENDTITNIDFNATDKEAITKASVSGTAQFSKTEEDIIFTNIGQIETEDLATGKKDFRLTEDYYKDGLFYHKGNDSNSNYCQPQEAGYGKKHFANYIFSYPKSTVASQSSKMTKDGELITVIFDSEKLYAYQYPKVYQEIGYGDSITYDEPYTFSIQLDKKGKLVSLHGTVYIVSQTDNGYSSRRDFTFTYHHYKETIPDFSRLNPKEYRRIPLQ